MTKQNIHVALLGMGTVGSGVYEILMKRKAKHFKLVYNLQLKQLWSEILKSIVIKLMKKLL